MPDPLMDTLDEIDRKSGNRGRSFCHQECPPVTNKTGGHSW